MLNLAGRIDCDFYTVRELTGAGVPYHRSPVFGINDEVPSQIRGFLKGWTFKRAWYYWVVFSEETLLLFKYADPLHEKHGQEVRVDGHCGCPAPREWRHRTWDIGVSSYHIDSQEGLSAFVSAVLMQMQDSEQNYPPLSSDIRKNEEEEG